MKDKLSEYEAIDKDLGCPWPIAYKALRDGYYYRDFESGVIRWSKDVGIRLRLDGPHGARLCCFRDAKTTVLLKDHGITWALTEEELE